jgi:catalase
MATKRPMKKTPRRAPATKNSPPPPSAGDGATMEKVEALEPFRESGEGQFLTTNHGVRISDNQNTLKAGARGPSLLEDFIFREKITHFDHERIPERVVHARGTAAHGHFRVYRSLAKYTRAAFLQDPSVSTPVFVRFSTVAGSRGSSDLARDVRGFAVKFYTSEGNFDLVGNNIPVFFIQDAVKFPDLIHSVKPEPHNEIPQAASAHDTFWDFVSVMPESMHMIMWVMSDRAIPRSLRMMEGFGIHTFRLVDAEGRSRFAKFHWKPLLGVHSVLWDEALKISGKDPDFHRRDMWEAIESGAYPEWELGLQIVDEADEHKFDFDLLDPTKIIPEELVPVERVGRLTLDRNPDNFFAETEQVAFHPGHVVPGIDFTDDPLLQGRLFSYTDTQLLRLGGPNFHEIPVNRPVAPVHNNQRDGHMRQTINVGRVSYQPNTMGGGCPMQAGRAAAGFASFPERIDASKARARSEKFFDHFSQATLFWNSQSDTEKNHVVDALRFELGKVEQPPIRERVLRLLAQVDGGLARRVAEGLGMEVPARSDELLNQGVPADVDPKTYQPTASRPPVERSAALSMANTVKDTARSRKVAILAADGVDARAVEEMKRRLDQAGAQGKVVGPHGGALSGANGGRVAVDYTLLTVGSVLFDAVFVPGGDASAAALSDEGAARLFVAEAYKHCKALAATGAGAGLLPGAAADGDGSRPARAGKAPQDEAVIVGDDGEVGAVAERFIEAIGRHRNWEREPRAKRLAV